MKQSQASVKLSEREYKKAFIKLLTQAVQATRRLIGVVDEYFFGTIGKRDEDTESIRPFFYGSISFGLAILLFYYVAISG